VSTAPFGAVFIGGSAFALLPGGSAEVLPAGTRWPQHVSSPGGLVRQPRAYAVDEARKRGAAAIPFDRVDERWPAPGGDHPL